MQCLLHYDLSISLAYGGWEMECGDMNKNYLSQAHVFEYLVSILWYYLGRLCNLGK